MKVSQENILKIFLVILFVPCFEAQLLVSFSPNELEVYIDKSSFVNATFSKKELFPDGAEEILLQFLVKDEDIIEVEPKNMTLKLSDYQNPIENITIPLLEVNGIFIGRDSVRISWKNLNNEQNEEKHSNELKVAVIRKIGLVDDAFTYSVAALLAIINVNIGACLHIPTVIKTLKRPIAPLIGVFCQFLIMPLLAYGVGQWIIPDPTMRLGLFMTGASPGGGVSNIWALMLNVNLDLSITMTTISTFGAFAMMPLWLFTLGKKIFDDAELKIPYTNILLFAILLIVPLGVGLFVQKKLPKIAKILIKIIKPFSTFILLFLAVFAVIANLYLFKLLNWENIVAGFLMTLFGYILGGLMAYLCRLGWKDILAIAVETGVQNTGLAIFALRFSLPQPEADLTTVQPFIATISMMIPALIILIFKKIFPKLFPEDEDSNNFTLKDSKDKDDDINMEVEKFRPTKEL